MRPIKGLTLPNRQWAMYTQAEEAAIMDLHPTGILVLGYPQSSILRDKVAQDARIWRELGQPEFILRPYQPNLVEWDPVDWARECLSLIDLYIEAGISADHIQLLLANEMNREGWGENWLGMAEWLNAGADIFHYYQPDVILHLPALSPEGGYLAGYQMLGRLSFIDRFQRGNAHIYTIDQAAELPRIQMYLDLPMVVTEYNRLYTVTIHRIFDRFLWFYGAYYFLLHWDFPEAGAPDVDLVSDANTGHYQDFKDYIVQEDPKTTMTKAELWSELTTPWSSYPALGKAIVALGGQVISTEVTKGNYVFQLGIIPDLASHLSVDVVAWAVLGDWEHVEVAYTAAALPDTEAASH